MRDPLEEEIGESRHGSFTKVLFCLSSSIIMLLHLLFFFFWGVGFELLHMFFTTYQKEEII